MKEEEIRPAVLFDQYLELAEKDIPVFFTGIRYDPVPCPSCGSTASTRRFRKKGFDYAECDSCLTLFVNPRPSEEAFSRFYRDSPSVRFWATHFYKETERARQELLIRPKAEMAARLIRRYTRTKHSRPVVVDIGAGYGGFCVALKSVLQEPFVIMGIEPASALQEVCREKNIAVIPKFLKDVSPRDFKGGDVVAVTTFELLEHLYDPKEFIRQCNNILVPGGILILTTLNGKGFDLQMLGEKSRSINPPHHINFFNPHSLSLLMRNEGFEVLEISTPGKLDVDIVLKQTDDVQCEFVRNLLMRSNESVRGRIQEILQETQMSSHMMIVARKT